MRLKSLLTTAVVVCSSAAAFAEFPAYTPYPAPGTITDAASFESVTFQCAETIKPVANAAKPYFESVDYGDQVVCTNFEFFLNAITKVEFNSSDFTENGEWELVVPAGCLEDSKGNTNEKKTFTYILQDATLAEFPQIDLLSSDPANGAALPFWGESLGKVSFVTSDDDAVNYIGWYLYDITNGDDEASREWLRQGSENRYDVNRTFGDASDQWTNGLLINVGGADMKMLKGHTYRLYLTFAGIGYDVATNQYPSPQQIAASTELETYLDFTGLVVPTEYSPYEVENVMPNPEEYEFDNPDMRTFTVVYTGPVKPTLFTYPLGMGAGAAPAGAYEAEDPDANGYAKVWNFTFEESVLKQSLGEIMITIEASDADGLPVRGNGGFATDDFSYKIMWKANLGADKLVSVSPENGQTVESLSSITVSNEAGKAMFIGHNTAERPRLVSSGRAGVAIDLDEPTFSEDEKEATWTFDEITAPGTYSLIIPKWYFNVGTEFESTTTNQTSFTYIIEGEEPGGDVEEDLLPVEVSIADGAVLEQPLENIVLTFENVTFMDLDPIVPGVLYRVLENDETEVIEEVEPMDNDMFNPTEYTYTFNSPVAEAGNYRFVVPAGTFYDETYDMSGKETGHISPELVYNFSIAGASAPVLVSVYPVDGETVEKLFSLTVSTEDRQPLYLNEDVTARPTIVSADRAYIAIDLGEPEFNEDHTEATWRDFDTLTEAGTYTLSIPAGYFLAGSETEGTATAATQFTYNIEGGDEPPVQGVTEDFIPTASVQENENYNSLDEIVLDFGTLAFTETDWDWNPFALGTLYRAADGEYVMVEALDPTVNDSWNPTAYTYTFSSPITEAGVYKFVIEAGLFWNQAYEDSWHESGRINPELVYNFSIGDLSGIEAILAGNSSADVYDLAGRMVVRNANAEQIKALTAGVYIINGKKYVVK